MTFQFPPRPVRPPRILVLGDVMLDRYTWGDVERVSPEAPIPILRADQDEVRPGGAASVATLLSHLDADVTLLGVVGVDPESNILPRILYEHRVDASRLITVTARPTTCKHRYIGRAAGRHPHQMLRVDREQTTAIDGETESAILETTTRVLKEEEPEAVLVSDYGKGVCTDRVVSTVIESCRRSAVPVLVDPAHSVDPRRYRGATLLTPNRLEAETLSGRRITTPQEALDVANRLRAEFGIQTAMITLDRDGLVISDQRTREHCPTIPREVYDITGAGDMVLAMCGYGYAARWTLRDIARLANRAAGLQVERFGVEAVSWSEIVEGISRVSSPKICTISEAAEFATQARHHGRRVVFTNGCFDLFHVGHLQTLRTAVLHGEILIVGINSDRSVRQLKGVGRPVIPQEHRADILAAFDFVHRVVIYEDETPHALLRSIRPDVLVKGGTTMTVIGREVVEAYGGQIVTTDIVPDLSTTAILKSRISGSSDFANSSRLAR